MKKGLLSVMMALIAFIIPANSWAQDVAGDETLEPYAVLSDNNTVLTFYYDENKAARNGMDVGPFTLTYDQDRERYINNSGWDEQRENIINVVFDASFANCMTLTSTAYWFFGFKNLSIITGISNLKTDNVTNMYCMFYGCSGLTSLNVSGFNTQNVTNMSYMFDGCSSLTSLDVTGFNTQNVTNMYCMFYYCSSLTDLDLSNFKTDKVTDMGGMFYHCSGLTSLDVTGFNTQNVTDMDYMFYRCSGLRSLDISSFNISKVIDNIEDSHYGIASMFYGSSKLTTIFVGDGWTTTNLTESPDVFKGCSSLVGGAGTHYSSDHTDYTYAHIDGGTANPGYFTATGAEPWTGPEPYAVLSQNNTVLTFYYDDQKAARNGMSVGPFEYTIVDNKLTNIIRPDWYQYRNSITNIIFDNSFANCTSITSTAFWFTGCESLISIVGLNNLNTENVTDMRSMFNGCSNLTSLDVTGFNTSKVVIFYGLFSNCEKLTNIDVSHFDTSNAWDMRLIFNYCSSLTELDVSHFNIENVNMIGGIFQGCSGLTKLDLSNFNTEHLTTMDYMFNGCSGLTSLDVSGFKTDNVIRMEGMFAGCSGLTSLDVSGFKTDNVTYMEHMFRECSGLTSLDVTGFNTQNVTDMAEMFDGCSNLTNLNVSGFKTDNVTDMAEMFSDCSKLTSLDMTGFNTQNVTEMGGMFYGCSSLTSLNMPGFKTDNVTNMDSMFQGCSNLTGLDVSNFKTDNVKGMREMFYGCSNLTSLNVSGFKTDKVTDMAGMFRGCSGLTGLDVSNFKTDNVTYMDYMFQGCSNLTSLDLSRFKTDNIIDIGYMFSDCSKLTSLDLSSFNTSKVTYNLDKYLYGIASMFENCSGLTTIYVGDSWTTANLTESADVFKGCSHLVGGAGTRYDANHTDYTYAHIDGGTENPGYFTAAGAEPWTGSAPIVVNLINNGDMEGNDNGNFYYRRFFEFNEALPQPISDGVGVNESRGIRIETQDKKENVYDNEFWFHFNQPVSEGTRFKLTYDARADREARLYIGAHGPAYLGDFIWNWMEPYVSFGTKWQTFTYEGTISSTVSSDQKPLASLAFSLNETPEANTYYFDNVKFEVYLEDQCPKPTFVQKENENEVSIQSPFDATIYYTTDGSEPTTNSEHATSTIVLSLSENTTIRAIAVVDGYEPSPVATYAFEYSTSKLDERREELSAMLMQLGQVSDNCSKVLADKDTGSAQNLWKELSDIQTSLASMKSMIDIAQTEEEMDKCEERLKEIAARLDWLQKEIDNLSSGEAHFDGLTAWVSSGATLDEAFAQTGGREEAAKTIAAIVWENTTALTADMLQGINNSNLLVYVNEASLAPQGIQNVVINGQAKKIILTDAATGNNNFFCPQAFRAEKISYTRDFQQTTQIGISRGWEGIALPFNVQSITHESKGALAPFGTGTGVKHFWLRAYDGENMYSAHQMEAYVPYVIAMPNSKNYYVDYNLNGRVTFSATNTEVYETPDFSNMENEPNIRLMTIPAFQTKTRSEQVYAINVGQARNNYAEGSVFEAGLREVRPFEVYTVHHGQGARPRFIPIIAHGNETTEIENLEESTILNSDWFDLNGRKLSTEPKRKGVYIQNGKKIRLK